MSVIPSIGHAMEIVKIFQIFLNRIQNDYNYMEINGGDKVVSQERER